MPRISFSSIFVSDQRRAKAFYTTILGFQLAVDRPAGDDRWLAVVSDDDPSGTQLLLEPADAATGRSRQNALFRQGIPATSFEVDDIDYEYERLVAEGVTFQSPPTDSGGVRSCILDDTCGNWIRLTEPIEEDQ
ncbi:VOC family protein [Cumulibacter manganitolerans]|uniref:VOC family protein n=1 Tax=Cumulibacter manganitolerans TaxID=1884992 RepID=UPI001E2CB2AF|nr:VOC family protein [Cumulibacter manganitolerans]